MTRVGDLRMYYEIHGDGEPLVFLHGAYMTIDSSGPIIPGLAETREVIAFEVVLALVRRFLDPPESG
jgi:hypothetical protein